MFELYTVFEYIAFYMVAIPHHRMELLKSQIKKKQFSN